MAFNLYYKFIGQILSERIKKQSEVLNNDIIFRKFLK